MSDNDLKPWYVYIIRTTVDTYYTGITNNVSQRLQAHDGGKRGAKFFRTGKPAALVYLEAAVDRRHASRREAQIKQLQRRDKLVLVRCQAPIGFPQSTR